MCCCAHVNVALLHERVRQDSRMALCQNTGIVCVRTRVSLSPLHSVYHNSSTSPNTLPNTLPSTLPSKFHSTFPAHCLTDHKTYLQREDRHARLDMVHVLPRRPVTTRAQNLTPALLSTNVNPAALVLAAPLSTLPAMKRIHHNPPAST
jgi:hypothetical protein